MQISGKFYFRDRYDGEKRVYLTGIEVGGPGDIKLSGEFGDVPLFTELECEGEVLGRIFDNNLVLSVPDPKTFKMREVKKSA